MSFIRPEIRAGLVRHRVGLIGLAAIALGAVWISGDPGFLQYLGGAWVALGFYMIWDWSRRVRFPESGGGTGVVEVDERRLSYFGPDWGGAVSINELARVRINTTAAGPLASDMFWEFTDTAGQRLTVPSDAEGADAIFDALQALAGVDFDAVIAANASTEAASFLIWQAPNARRALTSPTQGHKPATSDSST